MESSVGQIKKFGIADKIMFDEYERIVENTAEAVRGLRLRGKGAVSYINWCFSENVEGIYRNIPRKQFVSETLLLLYKNR